MAEPPKPEWPSRSKKAPEPDFSPFEDWLIDGPAGEWPEPWEADKELTEQQKRIVAANARDLAEREAWLNKVQAFEAAMSALADETRQKAARAKYRIHFDRHVFADGLKYFSEYPFPCAVSFRGATFGDGDVSFHYAKFGDGIVSFSGASFGEGTVWFNGASYGKGDVYFDGSNFGEGEISFYGASFGEGTVLFSGASFGEGAVSFNGASFGEGTIWFRGASFGEGTVSFHGASFGEGTVSFAGASFGKGDVSFSGASFGEGTVRFTKASFGEGIVSFDRASFGEGDVWFSGINFRSTIMLASGMVVAGNLYVKSHFPESVDFSRLDVKGTASFSGSSFDKVPDFRDAKFDRPPEVAGMVVPRPKLNGWKKEAADPEDVAKFRKLKSMALAANDHEKDGEFFAGEMLAKRGFETDSFFGLLFNTIYWWLSDFGQSFVRPLLWLGASYLAFAATCLCLIRDTLTPTDQLWFAADYSFRNLTPLFGSLFRFAPAPTDHVSWYQNTYDRLRDAGVDIDRLISLGIAQSMIGTVLLFLLLLALRNKFRLK